MISRAMFFDYYTENPPTTIGAAYQFCQGLVELGLFYPFDKDPEVILDDATMERAFSAGECWQLRAILPSLTEALENTAWFEGGLPALVDMVPGACPEIENHVAFYPRWGFGFDEQTSLYPGWNQPGQWNGWAKPFFERDIALDVLGDIADQVSFVDDGTTILVFPLGDSGDGNEIARLAPCNIRTSDGVKSVYDLAALDLTLTAVECLEADTEAWVGF